MRARSGMFVRATRAMIRFLSPAFLTRFQQVTPEGAYAPCAGGVVGRQGPLRSPASAFSTAWAGRPMSRWLTAMGPFLNRGRDDEIAKVRPVGRVHRDGPPLRLRPDPSGYFVLARGSEYEAGPFQVPIPVFSLRKLNLPFGRKTGDAFCYCGADEPYLRARPQRAPAPCGSDRAPSDHDAELSVKVEKKGIEGGPFIALPVLRRTESGHREAVVTHKRYFSAGGADVVRRGSSTYRLPAAMSCRRVRRVGRTPSSSGPAWNIR